MGPNQAAHSCLKGRSLMRRKVGLSPILETLRRGRKKTLFAAKAIEREPKWERKLGPALSLQSGFFKEGEIGNRNSLSHTRILGLFTRAATKCGNSNREKGTRTKFIGSIAESTLVTWVAYTWLRDLYVTCVPKYAAIFQFHDGLTWLESYVSFHHIGYEPRLRAM